MGKDILIIEDFCGTLNGNDNDRFVFIANHLSKNNSVELVTSDFCHEQKRHYDKSSIKKYDFKITMLKESGYSKNISIKRFLSHYFWGKRVYKYLRTRKKPDVIYCAVPTLAAAAFAAKYCKKNDIRFIIDIQDLWPEAFRMVFDVPVLSSLIFHPFSRLANYIYKTADEIVAVSETYLDRAKTKNNKAKGHSVFLGTSLKQFDHNATVGDSIKKENGEIRLGYCGTLGSSYDLKVVFDAMNTIKNPNLSFIIMGDGPLMDTFVTYSQGLRVMFTGRIPYVDMCANLKHCDIVINPIAHNAAQSIINKHADFAASGLPVISTQESEEYKALVNHYNMGFNVKNGDYNELAKRIAELCSDVALRTELGNNARKCALDLFDRDKTYRAIFDLFN